MKLILLGIVQLLILSLIMYLALFRTKKSSPKVCKTYSEIKSKYTGNCLNSENLDDKIPASYKDKIPSGTNAVNRQKCNGGDEQKWIVEDGGKIKNLKTGQYLYTDPSYPGWAALGDPQNKAYSNLDFSWDIKNIQSINNLNGISVGNDKIDRTLQDNPNWTHLIFNPSSVPPASPFDEEVWSVENPTNICK
jgi:hypothetical protein